MLLAELLRSRFPFAFEGDHIQNHGLDAVFAVNWNEQLTISPSDVIDMFSCECCHSRVGNERAAGFHDLRQYLTLECILRSS